MNRDASFRPGHDPAPDPLPAAAAPGPSLRLADAGRFRRLDALLAAALDLPADDRRAFLAAACADDPEAAREVVRLLDADLRSGPLDAAPEERGRWLAAALEEGPEGEGARLGPYRLLRKLGEGGMGVVYLAERDDEEFRRRVAVKILRPGLPGAEALARFRAERQTLARLEHPGIARLYDGGTTAGGRPFLVLEYVEGEPLDRHCDRHRLTVDGRLDLFAKICAAVDYAHRNLLVHRDLKPANVVVDAAGEPRLLDFGIAKQLSPGDGTATRTGIRPMTPAYASPEQVRGEPVTTASDVFSLGVVLYELLTGRRPFGEDCGSDLDLARAICEREPARPSAAVLSGSPPHPPPPSPPRTRAPGSPPAEGIAERAAARGTTPRALARRLAGDLDNIALRALAKEPGRRYRSAAALAEDLERHRAHLPVLARPAGALDRALRFVRRHRTAVAATAAAVALLAFLVARLGVEAGRHARERDKAERALAFLVETFAEADPYQVGGEPPHAGAILAAGARRLEDDPTLGPEVRAALLDAIGRAYLGLGDSAAAAPLLEQALELRRLHEAGVGEVAASLEALAELRERQADFPAAEAALREALALRRGLGGAHLPLAATMNRLGALVAHLGRRAEAAALHEEALAFYRGQRTPMPREIADTLFDLAQLVRDDGDAARSESLYREALALYEEALGPRHPTTLMKRSVLGLALLEAGDPAAAELILRRAAAEQRKVLPADHPDLLNTLNNLALARKARGDLAGAEALFAELLAARRRQASPATTAAELNNLGAVQLDRGRIAEAEASHIEALALRRQVYGDAHPAVAQSTLHLARVRQAQGRDAEALRLAGQALAILESALGPDHPLLAHPLGLIGRLHLAAGRPDLAEPALARAVELRSGLPPDHPDRLRAQAELEECRAGQRAPRP